MYPPKTLHGWCATRGRGQGAWIGGVERWRGQVAGIGVLRGDGDRGVDRGRGEVAGTGGEERGWGQGAVGGPVGTGVNRPSLPCF